MQLASQSEILDKYRLTIADAELNYATLNEKLEKERSNTATAVTIINNVVPRYNELCDEVAGARQKMQDVKRMHLQATEVYEELLEKLLTNTTGRGLRNPVGDIQHEELDDIFSLHPGIKKRPKLTGAFALRQQIDAAVNKMTIPAPEQRNQIEVLDEEDIPNQNAEQAIQQTSDILDVPRVSQPSKQPDDEIIHVDENGMAVPTAP